MTLHSQIRHGSQRRAPRRTERGYVMLTLLLAMALMVIFAGAIIPTITFEIKRDREEEMIHRGVQYSRAVRAYYKKFGRYPTKIEDLENTNHQRFLRKRYKDPLNCKSGKCEDFKLVYFGEVQMSLSGMSGGVIPGASPAGGNPGSGGSLSNSSFGGSGSFGGSSSSSFGQSPTQTTPGNPSGGNSSTPPDPSQTSADGTSAGTGSGSNQLGGGQIIGGPIIGVASATKIKDSTIREFNHKKKYKDWFFVYDPAQDQGRLITAPYQPQLAGFGQQGAPNLNGQSGSNGNSGFGSGSNSFGGGNNSGFGSSSSGFGNSPNPPSSGGFGQPNPPSSPPQQQ